jgi:hypothetical protein
MTTHLRLFIDIVGLGAKRCHNSFEVYRDTPEFKYMEIQPVRYIHETKERDRAVSGKRYG